MQLSLIGAILAGVRNAAQKQNVGARGIFTSSGRIIALYGAGGAAYQFTRDASANLRGIDDTYNEALGGFMAGAMAGVYRRSIPYMVTAGSLFGIVMAAFTYSGGFTGYKRDRDEGLDEAAMKQKAMEEYRRPIQEIIDELGEGRGIMGPGYAERRRQRLLENYGIDVGPATQGSRA
ncbi:hypothetical protein M011DRAFT_471233 [Sporormia fimetaria CBS 119925]|uniref:NADH-ubiquinone oxidoreductase 213 kDa subunit n=1 Tax=Sporormia fimetaria CBS 119925 TaxID=1340428 RepID=A0A6A6UZJ2_9PLEO|nr:hypothetical protein M011DRAFT_471233 [Sporormia fimetaria CBS 119925]